MTSPARGHATEPAGSPRTGPGPTASALWAALALVAVTVAAYAGVWSHDFVSLDDPLYVSSNRHVSAGLSWAGVVWAFTTGHAANWHPLTWLSHMLDVELFGLNAGGHHVTSLVLHVVNTLLLFAVLVRMTRAVYPSAIVAALFAVHPLHVESVAWIAERKDVLSGLFWMLTLHAYVSYVRRPRWNLLALWTLCLGLGLMAKPMLVTLPLVLLLVDVWPLERTGVVTADRGHRRPWAAWRPLLGEKAAAFVLVLASGVVTLVVQQHGGAVSGLDAIPAAQRAANAAVAYVSYIAQMFWPFHLIPFYPYPSSTPAWKALGALAVLVAVSLIAIRQAGRRPYLAVGWFWYVVTMLPVVGLVQVGMQAMADRYTYLPLVGLFIAGVWALDDWATRARLPRAAAAVAAVLAIAACAFATRQQAATWTNAATLWQHTLRVAPDNYYAHHAVASMLREQGRLDEAMTHFSEAIRLNPRFPDARNNLGLVLESRGRLDDAIEKYRAALEINPGMPAAHNNLGAALMRRGRFDEALPHLAEAVRIWPEFVVAHDNLGQLLSSYGRLPEATAEFREALRLQPDFAAAHDHLGFALAAQGRPAEAAAEYREALRLAPANADTHNNLGIALAALEQTSEAFAEFREALRLEPGHANAHVNLGFALAGHGQPVEAIPHFVEAIRLQPDLEQAHLYLGWALGGTGRFEEAAREFRTVLRINPANDGARRALDSLARGAQPPGR